MNISNKEALGVTLPEGVISTKSSGMVKDSIGFTLKKKVQLFNEMNGGRFRSVTEKELMAIEECFNAGEQGLEFAKMTPELFSGCCDASTPWRYASLAKILFNEGHSWEIDDDAYIISSKHKFYITYLGEIAFSQYEKKAIAALSELAGLS